MKNTRLLGHMASILMVAFSSSSTFARDPLRWPFAQDSIWNMPIGSNAVYVAANIVEPSLGIGMTIDEDIIVMRPDAPHTPIYSSMVGWSDGPRRCTEYDASNIIRTVPMPNDFVVSPDNWDGSTPNSGLAVLMQDGETIVQAQPFARCRGSNGPATALPIFFPEVNIFGDGIRGAHGGSGLSAIGGALRVGELVPGGVIRHALKVNLYGKLNLYQNTNEADGKSGYRWPAVKADTGFATPSSGNYYGGSNPALQMGSLLALHPTERLVSLNDNSLGLETEAALILARAFQDYGAYVVDNTAWDVYALVTEWGPDGRVNDEVAQNFGHRVNQNSQNSPFSRDMDRIFLNLYVVDNNSPSSIGGGGTPRAALAPDFASNNIAPVAMASASSSEAVIPATIDFSAESSFDSDGNIIRYDWDFGNGNTGSGSRVAHTYDTPGTYTVRLTVTDNASATANTTLMVRIANANVPPIAAANINPISGSVPLQVTFSGDSSNDPDGNIVSYQWSLEENVIIDTANTMHIYNIPGSYEVELVVTDNQGASSTMTTTINVLDTNSNTANNNSVTDRQNDGVSTENNAAGGGSLGILTLLIFLVITFKRCFINNKIIIAVFKHRYDR